MKTTEHITLVTSFLKTHDDVIKWKHFPRYWPFVRGIHRSPVNSPHKGQWRGALMFSLIYARINDWVNNREAGDLRRSRAHYDVTVMCYPGKIIFKLRIIQIIMQYLSSSLAVPIPLPGSPVILWLSFVEGYYKDLHCGPHASYAVAACSKPIICLIQVRIYGHTKDIKQQT